MSFFIKLSSKKCTNVDADAYKCVPSNIVNFPYGSILDTWYRLLKRGICHAIDTHCQSLVHSEVKLFTLIETDEVGIDIQHTIPASMKYCSYTVRIACTKNKVLCTQCTCKCGGDKSEKVTCVHTFVPTFLPALLLCEGLAEHLLLELSARLTVESDTSDTDVRTDLMENIRLPIICADGVKHDIGASTDTSDYNILLERFKVGTEKSTLSQKEKLISH